MPPGQHGCIRRQEDAEHPWTSVPVPPQLPVLLPARLLAPARCPGSSTGCPRCPRGNCLSLARDKPVAEQLVGFPQPWTNWNYLFLSEQPLASAAPQQHRSQPLILLHARQLPPRKRKDKASPMAGAGQRGARWKMPAQNPQQHPSGIAQPCQAQSILPLNMKLPLSPNPLPGGVGLPPTFLA